MPSRSALGLFLCLLLSLSPTGCSQRPVPGANAPGSAPGQATGDARGDTHQSLSEEQLVFAMEWDDILETVHDEASMKVAEDKIKALVPRAEQFEARRRKLPVRTYAEAEAMRKRNEKALNEMNSRHERLGTRIGQLPGGKDFWWRSEKSVGGHLTEY